MAPLKNKSIVIFTSPEEMDTAHYRETAAPIEKLRIPVKLILRGYGTTRKELN